jgi:hypothetical protein
LIFVIIIYFTRHTELSQIVETFLFYFFPLYYFLRLRTLFDYRVSKNCKIL